MKILRTAGGFASLALLSTANVACSKPDSARTTGTARVEVLGIHYGDGWASAVEKLHAAGLTDWPHLSNGIETTWDQYVETRSRNRTNPYYLMDRTLGFRDASGRVVLLTGLVTKSGYVVRAVRYTFHSDGGMAPVLAGLKAKFGTPKTGNERRFLGNYSAFTGPGDRPGVALVLEQGLDGPQLEMAVFFADSDVIATSRAIDAEAARRGGSQLKL